MRFNLLDTFRRLRKLEVEAPLDMVRERQRNDFMEARNAVNQDMEKEDLGDGAGVERKKGGTSHLCLCKGCLLTDTPLLQNDATFGTRYPPRSEMSLARVILIVTKKFSGSSSSASCR